MIGARSRDYNNQLSHNQFKKVDITNERLLFDPCCRLSFVNDVPALILQVMLTALQAQLEMGDCGDVLEDYRSIASHCLPPRFVPNIPHEGVALHHQSLRGMTSAEAKKAFLNLIQSWPLHKATIFDVMQSFTSNWPRVLWLAVDQDGLHLLEHRSRNALCSYEYDSILSYSPALNCLMIITGSEKKQSKVILTTSQAFQIANLIREYTEVLQSPKQIRHNRDVNPKKKIISQSRPESCHFTRTPQSLESGPVVTKHTNQDCNLKTDSDRELDMGAKLIIQMDGKKTRIFNTKATIESCGQYNRVLQQSVQLSPPKVSSRYNRVFQQSVQLSPLDSQYNLVLRQSVQLSPLNSQYNLVLWHQYNRVLQKSVVGTIESSSSQYNRVLQQSVQLSTHDSQYNRVLQQSVQSSPPKVSTIESSKSQ
ncbi:unnamed protein product [Timema podura]|uniref:FERM domain-containing protein n=1 Tax=Timema podura TaxID=61482 RepID=A0ABN7NFD9_TIMPD|nr:unnamed protein product [Timema podura]